ncbi:hypothetical protein J4448_00020 [Candidatus Woesearchaeota archaeon]|nr:hypothetical protein [Candidatus Woesearchaeota archaeon]
MDKIKIRTFNVKIDNKLMNKLRIVLNKQDPIGIYFDKKTNFDEYDPEIKNIYNDFNKCKNFKEFSKLVYSIFQYWFGADVAGNKIKYSKLSRELYHILKKHLKNDKTKPKILFKK